MGFSSTLAFFAQNGVKNKNDGVSSSSVLMTEVRGES